LIVSDIIFNFAQSIEKLNLILMYYEKNVDDFNSCMPVVIVMRLAEYGLEWRNGCGGKPSGFRLGDYSSKSSTSSGPGGQGYRSVWLSE
jgi:hypothetical protein